MDKQKDLENVEPVEESMEVFENDIELYLKLFCDEYKIKDLHTMPQSTWNGALMYIKKHVFKDKTRLKVKGSYTKYNNNYDNVYNNNFKNSNCNSYDLVKVNDICDIYIYLCMTYNKEVSILGFHNLTGIAIDNIYNWADGSHNVSNLGLEIYKKLNSFREESLSNKLATGNKNPVGILAILNRHYQWNLPGVTKERTQTNSISVTQMQALEDIKSKANADE